MDVVMWQITCGRILFSPLSEHYIPIPYLIDFLVQEADAHSFCRLSPEFTLFVDNLRLCAFLNKLGNLFHETVCGCIVRDYGGNADHDDLVGVLLIDFCSRYMKLVLQLCNVQSAVSLLD